MDAGTDWQTISLDADDAPQFNVAVASFQKMLLFTDAGDGNTGTYFFDDISAPEAAPETCSDGIQNQDEAGVDCGGSTCGPCDIAIPTAFTATVGTVGGFSVELLSTATDDSGTVTYDVIYGSETAQTTGVSGVETPMTISGLTPETAYIFEVSATDASANAATNNAISVSATTTADTSTACAGVSTELQPAPAGGSLNGGTYDYAFETLTNGVVRMTFELSTAVTGLVAYAWRETPFVETPMTLTGNVATLDLTGLTSGATISYAVKFGWAAGGTAITKYFTYTVGDYCSTAGLEDHSLSSVKMHPNPANGVVKFSTATPESLSVSVYDLLGKQVIPAHTVQSELNISNLNSGMYFVNIKQGASSLTKKLLVK